MGLRSIPAGAGEPCPAYPVPHSGRVDPRGCGGAAAINEAMASKCGRSPRVRGSHRSERGSVCVMGSIPAGAGEPRLAAARVVEERVDPRGCGGAPSPYPFSSPCRGRSPRVRGSRCDPAFQAAPEGSIPAGAGEPSCPTPRRPRSWVDPRGCGGAIELIDDDDLNVGRSPRVRGSLHALHRRALTLGSIPAGAGEPTARSGLIPRRWVDPRGCGGAGCVPSLKTIGKGRSPRVRGSPADPALSSDPLGSIPAGAGEP